MALSNRSAGRLAYGGGYAMAGAGAWMLHASGYDLIAGAVVYVTVVSLMVVGLMRFNRGTSRGRA